MANWLFEVTDLKQYTFCPRIVFYRYCLPKIRPITYLMQEGIRGHHLEKVREESRSLRHYGLKQGERFAQLSLVSKELGLTGRIDLAIAFGPGEEGAARKAARRPVLSKRITGELGNVSPVIIVPGPWSAGDLAYQGAHIVSMLTNNSGFNCNATRVIIQYEGWQQRKQLLQQMRQILAQVPVRDAYYPGARERQKAFVAAHAEAEQFGNPGEKQLPWTLISGVDAHKTDDICFTTEAFCGLFAETMLEASTIPDYIDRAVAFANEHLWGTLSATLIVHPKSLKDPAIAAAVERATANLRYGSVGINYWAGISYALGTTPWGAFPGHDIYNIQSGTGVVHNTLMFSRLQKGVLRAPFRSVPTPPWFVTRSNTSTALRQRWATASYPLLPGLSHGATQLARCFPSFAISRWLRLSGSFQKFYGRLSQIFEHLLQFMKLAPAALSNNVLSKNFSRILREKFFDSTLFESPS